MAVSATLIALTLVLVSAFAHATWNLLLKRAQRQEVFVWWLSAAGVVGAAPVAVFLAFTTEFSAVGLWFVVASSLVHICYFLSLGRSLARADLSLAYPIARGFGPGLVPILAVFALDESVTLPAWVGIGVIVLGIYTMAWWGQLRNIVAGQLAATRAGIAYALATGICIALYTLIDKQGVAYVSPFLYLYLMTCGVAVGMLPYILRTHGASAVDAGMAHCNVADRCSGWPLVPRVRLGANRDAAHGCQLRRSGSGSRTAVRPLARGSRAERSDYSGESHRRCDDTRRSGPDHRVPVIRGPRGL